ncbi:hypothetical protein JVU11DRAFT_6950 [Chiua virens]|nr:hypothetical protein JVU11DRAFT_6950 [Chiua virens]
MPATTLVPGYRHVESFGPDEDYLEEEEEVSYVTLDLGVVEPTLLPSTSTYRLIGLDTPTPFLQLSGSIFKGRHDTLLGTELLFTEKRACVSAVTRDTERQIADDGQTNKRSLVHIGSTEQRLRFKEVQLKEKARAGPTPVERKEAELLEEVASMYVDPEIPSQAATEQPNSTTRKRKKGTRKGKERAVEDDAMDTT